MSGEWFPLYFDVVDHERIAGADLTHIPKTFREDRREAMFGLYVRALRDLQRARSNDGLIAKHALWGPAEARRAIAEELERIGMLEVREGRYYPRNYLEKNRSGDKIRSAAAAATERQRDVRARKKAALLEASLTASHTDVTRDSHVVPVCVSVSAVSGSLPDPDLPPQSGSPREAYVDAGAPSAPAPDPAPSGVMPAVKWEAPFHAASYAAGQSDGSGGAFAVPTRPSELQALLTMAATHARAPDGAPLRGEALSAWFRATAAAYRRAQASASDYQRGFAPSKCLEWLDSKRPVAGALRSGLVQPVRAGGFAWKVGPP